MDPVENALPSSIFFPEDLGSWIREQTDGRTKGAVFLVCDAHTHRHCLPLVRPFLPQGSHILRIPAGESSKNLDTCVTLWNQLTQKQADRQALILALGGGMVCDLAAFSASVYKRGIDFVLIPTSLLAMTDAAFGGKTGVDFQDFKNQLGTFAQPQAIGIWPGFLKTLPGEEILSGFAEVIKQALIARPLLWESIRKRELEAQNWPELVKESLAVKHAVVKADPFEKHFRKVLNAGHTLGHALETLFLKKGNPIPHGHAVAAGLIIESRIALEKGLLPEADLVRMEELIFALYGMLPVSKSDIPKLIRYCLQDKKNQAGKIELALVGPVGNCSPGQMTTELEIKMAIRYYLGS